MSEINIRIDMRNISNEEIDKIIKMLETLKNSNVDQSKSNDFNMDGFSSMASMFNEDKEKDNEKVEIVPY